jgi:hypothetical protein
LIVAFDHSWNNRGSRSMRMNDRKRFEGLESVARSRQVCMKWLWKHCLLLSIYLKKEHILIDTGIVVGPVGH